MLFPLTTKIDLLSIKKRGGVKWIRVLLLQFSYHYDLIEMTLVITKSKALKRVCFRNFEDFMLVTWGFVVSMEGLTQIRVKTQDN